MNLAVQYLTLNILMAAAFFFSLTTYLANGRFHFMKARQQLRFNYLLISLTLILSLCQVFLPHREFFKTPAKVWSASSSAAFNRDFSLTEAKGYLRLDFLPAAPVVNTQILNLFLWLAGLAALFFGLYRLWRDLRSLFKITRQSFLIRKFKTVMIFSSDLITVPFSFWVPGRHAVVIPNRMLGAAADCRTAILHEIQHHRQRDTYWIHLLWAVRVACCWNPAVYFWNKLFLEIQEFACDEALVDRNKVSSTAYAGCLVRVAETALNQERNFVCATGLTFLTDGHSLTRRIRTMFEMKKRKLNSRLALLAVVTMVGSLAGIAMASQGLIQDRRVTMKEAQALLLTAKTDNFPVVVNDLVLKQLNRYIGTPDGRDFMRKSLVRMESYRPMMERKLAEYGAPEELMAVPIIESGYQNLEQGPHSVGAGLWQFIAATARNYGLTVDDSVDQRLNPELLTDAAMRYQTANHLRFKDWGLAVFAFNVGEKSVQEAIDKTGSRDVWTLIRDGYENDTDYVAKIMAAILIMRNPATVQ